MSTPSPLTGPTFRTFIEQHVSKESQEALISIFEMKHHQLHPRHLHEMTLMPNSSLKGTLEQGLSVSQMTELESMISMEGSMLSEPFRPYPTLELATDIDSLWKKYSLCPTYFNAFKNLHIRFDLIMRTKPLDAVKSILNNLPLGLKADLEFAIWAENAQKELNTLKSTGKSTNPVRIKLLNEQLASVGLATLTAPAKSAHPPIEVKASVEKKTIPAKTLPVPSLPAITTKTEVKPTEVKPTEVKPTEVKPSVTPALILSESPKAPGGPSILLPEDPMPSAPGGPSTLSTRNKTKA